MNLVDLSAWLAALFSAVSAFASWRQTILLRRQVDFEQKQAVSKRFHNLKARASLVNAYSVVFQAASGEPKGEPAICLANATSSVVRNVSVEISVGQGKTETVPVAHGGWRIIPPGEWVVEKRGRADGQGGEAGLPWCPPAPLDGVRSKKADAGLAIVPQFFTNRRSRSLLVRSMSFTDCDGNQWRWEYALAGDGTDHLECLEGPDKPESTARRRLLGGILGRAPRRLPRMNRHPFV